MGNELIPAETILEMVRIFRGQKVMLDEDLAALYGVETKTLNRAVKRNLERFPEDFMFQLADEEWEILRFQIGTSKKSPGGRRYSPYVFTEQGVAMLSSVLNSERAIKVNIEIMRAFVRMRLLMASHQELFKRLEDLEGHVTRHNQELAMVFDAIRQLMAPPDESTRKIGF